MLSPASLTLTWITQSYLLYFWSAAGLGQSHGTWRIHLLRTSNGNRYWVWQTGAMHPRWFVQRSLNGFTPPSSPATQAEVGLSLWLKDTFVGRHWTGTSGSMWPLVLCVPGTSHGISVLQDCCSHYPNQMAHDPISHWILSQDSWFLQEKLSYSPLQIDSQRFPTASWGRWNTSSNSMGSLQK